MGCSNLSRLAARLLTPLAALAFYAGQSHALPAFAQQTGQPCSACHVGGFGPQLTPYGRSFKLHAYGATDSWKAQTQPFTPLAAMAVATFTHTARDQSAPPANNFGRNDNDAIQEVDAFLAGKLAPGLGAFVQFATTDMIAHNTSWDNTDVKYGRDLTLFGKKATLGLSVNNSPGVQDAWNTVPVWGFPYVDSALAPSPIDQPLLAGALAHQVVGETAWAWIDDHYYVEAGGYQSVSKHLLDAFHEDIGPRVDGAAPYWRLAYNRDIGGSVVEVGTMGLLARLQPTRAPGPVDRYDDIGVDASWQRMGTGKHVFSANATYIDERRRLNATFPTGGSAFPSGRIDQLSLNGSYYYDRRWGLTAAVIRTTGRFDPVLYAPAPDAGSRTGRPDSTRLMLQADWTPFSSADWNGRPWASLRTGVQYSIWTRFNGSGSNYDGFGRAASDNDTLTVFVWSAF